MGRIVKKDEFNIAIQTTWGNSSLEFIAAGYIKGYPFTWGDTFIVEEAFVHSGEPETLNIWADKDEKKKRRIIELICRINGKFYNEKKDIKTYKLDIKDVKMLYNEIQKAKITIK